MLLRLKARGLDIEVVIGGRALGFWKALPQVWSDARHQRYWVYKVANALNKLPKSVQPKAKATLHEISPAETRADAEKAFDSFLDRFGDKYPAAATCLSKDRGDLLAFFALPALHWKHLRTTKLVESTIAKVRLRTTRTKRSGLRTA